MKDLNEILFNQQDNIVFDGYALTKKNTFEKTMFSSLNLSSYNQGEGEGIPYGHYIAFKYLMSIQK